MDKRKSLKELVDERSKTITVGEVCYPKEVIDFMITENELTSTKPFTSLNLQSDFKEKNYNENKLSVGQTIYIAKVRGHVRKNFPEFINTVTINGETGDILYVKESPSTGKKKYYTVDETGYLNFTYKRITDLELIEELLSTCVRESGIIKQK